MESDRPSPSGQVQPLPQPPGRVLVLGGTGFLGAEITRAFVQAGSQVTAVARHEPPKHRGEMLVGASLSFGEVEDPCFLEPLLDETEHVIFAVGCPLPAESSSTPIETVFKTLPGLIAALEGLRSRPATRFTFLSSGGTVYGNRTQLPVQESAPTDPITPYGIMKLAAEKYIAMYDELYGIPTSALRICNAYGPLQATERGQGVIAAFLAAARANDPVRIFGDGSIVRDYVFVEDVAKAAVDLSRLSSVPKVVNLGTGSGHSINDVLELVRTVTGSALPVERTPQRKLDVQDIVLDVGLLSSLLDWRPRSLEQGLASTWASMVEDPSEASELNRIT
jgi:UDP-glucose 4-epimerase